MNKIKLTQGKYAIIDDGMFDYLNQWKWCVNKGYAYRLQWNKETKKYDSIYMHQLINQSSKGYYTDHINRDKLDNRKVNLRTVTNQQNAFNSNKYSTNTSGVKGIHWDKFTKKWRASITINAKTIKLGRFFDIKDAIKARQEGEVKYHAI